MVVSKGVTPATGISSVGGRVQLVTSHQHAVLATGIRTVLQAGCTS